jgi:hypothetical protein
VELLAVADIGRAGCWVQRFRDEREKECERRDPPTTDLIVTADDADAVVAAAETAIIIDHIVDPDDAQTTEMPQQQRRLLGFATSRPPSNTSPPRQQRDDDPVRSKASFNVAMMLEDIEDADGMSLNYSPLPTAAAAVAVPTPHTPHTPPPPPPPPSSTTTTTTGVAGQSVSRGSFLSRRFQAVPTTTPSTLAPVATLASLPNQSTTRPGVAAAAAAAASVRALPSASFSSAAAATTWTTTTDKPQQLQSLLVSDPSLLPAATTDSSTTAVKVSRRLTFGDLNRGNGNAAAITATTPAAVAAAPAPGALKAIASSQLPQLPTNLGSSSAHASRRGVGNLTSPATAAAAAASTAATANASTTTTTTTAAATIGFSGMERLTTITDYARYFTRKPQLQLRTEQIQAIEAVQSGRDVVVVIATGGGKTLIYAVPALMATMQPQSAGGATLVCIPTLALLQTTYRTLREGGVDALILGENHNVDMQRLQSRPPAVVLVTPEAVIEPKGHAQHWIRQAHAAGIVLRVVIDEVHLVLTDSTFRPAFKELVRPLSSPLSSYYYTVQ